MSLLSSLKKIKGRPINGQSLILVTIV
jgi:hypothetical protein